MPSKCQWCPGKTSGYLAFFGWVTASANLVIGRFCKRQICATCSVLDRHLLVKFWLSNIFLQIWIPSNSSSPSHTKIWSNAGLMSFLNSFKDRLPFPSWMMTMRNSCEVVAVWTTLRLYPRAFLQPLEPGTGTKHLQRLDSVETEMCRTIDFVGTCKQNPGSKPFPPKK